MGLSAPSQAPSCSSKGALGLTLQEGAPSASLGKAVRRQGEHEEDATCGASFGHGKAGQDGLVHLRPATWEGAVQMPAAGRCPILGQGLRVQHILLHDDHGNDDDDDDDD
eukprot:1160272-Pelagomonas_calceolata.AAC.3